MSLTIVYVAHWDSREILVLRLDTEQGALSVVQRMGIDGTVIQGELRPVEVSPEAGLEPRGMPLAVSPDRRFLYASLREQPYSVATFAIDSTSGRLTYLATTLLADSMAYITTDRTGRALLSASTKGGMVTVNAIGSDGVVLEQLTHSIPISSSAHCVMADPANRFLVATSFGCDEIVCQPVDAATSMPSARAASIFSVPKGAGPRHFVFHPSGRFLYLLCERDGSIRAFIYSAETGTLHQIQETTALPPGFTGKPWAADIRMTPDGCFLYASERRSNTLAAFMVDTESGQLTPIGSYPTEQMPRSFNIDPHGRFLLAVGQVSHSLTVYAIEKNTGQLAPLNSYPMRQNPSWVEIVEFEESQPRTRKSVVVYKKISRSLLSSLQRDFDVSYFEEINASNRATFIDAIGGAHGLLGASVKLSADLLDLAPRLEIISTISAGVDQFDIEYLSGRGILLANTPDVLTETTADTVLALMMASARRVVELAEFVKEGKWLRSIDEPLYGVDVHSKTIGIVGMGRIGHAVARRAHLGFGMNVLYYNRSPAPEAEVAFAAKAVSLETLLSQADFVCVLLPLTPDTERLIGKREFALMRPDAIFINGSRGGIVDETALIEALQERRIRAAGLDVFEREPLSVNSPLLKMDNVVALPHIGSATHETRLAMATLAVENLRAGLMGERPPCLVNGSIENIGGK